MFRNVFVMYKVVQLEKTIEYFLLTSGVNNRLLLTEVFSKLYTRNILNGKMLHEIEVEVSVKRSAFRYGSILSTSKIYT